MTSQCTQSISTETALEILADQRCRSVLTQFLDSENNTVTLDALVTHVAPENPPPIPGGTRDTELLRAELHHNHLPKLENAGLIEYDDRTETARYYPNEHIEKLHQFVSTELE